mmetsp:Transcript_74511/g.125589  ORF Transcript_74511/g.125589 Transcript_74511/m.125589 type:complete len:658 (+) Transcript_74511:98-2071(+)
MLIAHGPWGASASARASSFCNLPRPGCPAIPLLELALGGQQQGQKGTSSRLHHHTRQYNTTYHDMTQHNTKPYTTPTPPHSTQHMKQTHKQPTAGWTEVNCQYREAPPRIPCGYTGGFMGHRVGEGMQVCRKGHQGLLQIICCLVRVVPIMATESAAAALAAALAESLAAALAAIPRMGAPAAGVPCHVRQLVRHMQACLDHDVGDLAGVFGLVGSQERHGSSLFTGTPGTTDAVDVVLGVVGGVEVDDHLDAADVETTRRHVRGHHDRRAARLEGRQGPVALPLLAVAVDGHARDAVAALQIPRQLAAHQLRRREDQDAVAVLHALLQQLQQLLLLLVHAVGDDDPLVDVRVRLEGVAGPDLHVRGIPQELVREAADLPGPRGREHHGLAVLGHLGDDHADLRFESHVQHPIGLVEHEVHHGPEPHCPHLQVVVQSPWRGDQHMGPAANLPQLRALRGPSVGACAVDPRGVAKLLRLGLDLAGELTRGREGQQQRPAGAPGVQPLLDHRAERGQQEPQSLAGAGLGDADEVAPLREDRPCVGLDRRRVWEAGPRQRTQELWRERALAPLIPRGHADALQRNFAVVDLKAVVRLRGSLVRIGVPHGPTTAPAAAETGRAPVVVAAVTAAVVGGASVMPATITVATARSPEASITREL